MVDLKTLKLLKTERTQVRRLTTNACKALELLFAVEGDKDVEKIDEKFHVVADLVERLFRLDSQVREILIENDTPEEELASEFDSVEEYRARWVTLTTKRNRLLGGIQLKPENVSDASSEASTVRKKQSHVKLARLEPKKFDGSLNNWIGFWSMFKTVDENEDLEPVEKFQYLLQFTKEGSPARELLDSFPPSAQNYPKALEQLKARFGRPDLLIELYVRELLKLVLIQATGNGKVTLHSLYDRLETQLRALESLGVAKDNYAYMLLSLVESALPESLLRLWERQRSSQPSADHTETQDSGKLVKGRLDELLQFLRKEVESEERMRLARDTFAPTSGVEKGKSHKKESARDSGKTETPGHSVPTAAGLLNVKESNIKTCIFCSGSHASETCVKCYDMPVDEVMRRLSEHGHCFLCFRGGHNKIRCRAVIKCVICSKKHNSVLCPSRRSKPPDPTDSGLSKNSLEHSLSNTHHCPVLLQTLRVKLRGKRDIEARVMIDTGSQRSYATRRILAQLEYTSAQSEHLVHALFGGTVQPQLHKRYKLHLANIEDSYACNFDVLDTEVICLAVPGPTDKKWLTELQEMGIILSDHGEGPIDVLIGADVAGKIFTGRRKKLSCGLVAMETLLGWTLMGKSTDATTTAGNVHVQMICAEASPSDLWRLDILGIEDPAQKLTKEQSLMLAKTEFEKSVKILEDGRYEVGLPWLEDHPPLQRNFDLAVKRFNGMSKKLKNSGHEKDYYKVLLDWQQEGIIEEVPKDEWDKGHYLPHRAVFKEGSTTPLRPVFDASTKEKGHPSLNQCLNPGPNLIEKLFSLLIRFRKGKYGLLADIKRAFLNIALALLDRDFLRFIWIDENGLKIFRHCRVVFGVCCSPFLWAAVIEHLLDRCEEMIKDGKLNCPQWVIERLRKSLYVDNYVSSHPNLDEVNFLIEHARSIFALACFDLRGWERTNPQLPMNTETPVLGIIWDQKNDTLKIKNPDFLDLDASHFTKRDLASASHRLFDPIGLTCPVTVVPKRLFQKTALYGGGWDKVVDQDSRDEISRWMAEIHWLQEIEIPRWFENYELEGADVSLHTFCDASQLAYAAVVFIRVEFEGTVTVQLVSAKSRIAPPEKITIPRLELLAAVVGARLTHRVLESLDNVHETVYWSDSSTVLCWIRREEPWSVFVGNRVKEIRLLSNSDSWYHVPGVQNPADLASRGCFPKALVQSRWWEGPHWLKLSKDNWPNSTVTPDEELVLAERRKNAIAAVDTSNNLESLNLAGPFSCFFRVVRVVGWIFRFATNSRMGISVRNAQESRRSGDLTPAECTFAERRLLKIVQTESFPDSSNEKAIKRLKPQIDQNGLIRIRTKIWARKDAEDFRAPIVLSPDHPITDMLMKTVHVKNQHVAGHGLLNLLREKYWILRGKQAVRRTVKNCVPCQKVCSKNLEADSPPLPEDRVRDACIFEVIGTDLAGPLYLRDGTKVWIVIFTCAIFRAVHLDLTPSQSTDGFILALRRFIARRGRPNVIFSDNGGNFRGTFNALLELDWEKIKSDFRTQEIEWRFNPPTGSWWGGFFERVIGLVKVLLKKNLGRASLDYSELYTLLCECEMMVNSRPITYVSDGNDGPLPISPSMFLQEIREAGIPDLEELDASGFQRRQRRRQRIKEELRERFRSEYLSQLVCSNKKRKETREPVIGELVMVGSDNKKRIDWPLAVVESLLPGPDGKCRVVKLRTVDGELIRPIQRIYPLEVFSSEEACTANKVVGQPTSSALEERVGVQQHDCESPRVELTPKAPDDPSPKISREVTTRCGRKVVLPLKLR